jgi:hypothetical protein
VRDTERTTTERAEHSVKTLDNIPDDAKRHLDAAVEILRQPEARQGRIPSEARAHVREAAQLSIAAGLAPHEFDVVAPDYLILCTRDSDLQIVLTQIVSAEVVKISLGVTGDA